MSILLALWHNPIASELVEFHRQLASELDADLYHARAGLRYALRVAADSGHNTVVLLSTHARVPVPLIANAIETGGTWAAPSEYTAGRAQASLSALVKAYSPAVAVFDREGIEEVHQAYEEVAELDWPLFEAYTYALAAVSLPDREFPKP